MNHIKKIVKLVLEEEIKIIINVKYLMKNVFITILPLKNVSLVKCFVVLSTTHPHLAISPAFCTSSCWEHLKILLENQNEKNLKKKENQNENQN